MNALICRGLSIPSWAGPLLWVSVDIISPVVRVTLYLLFWDLNLSEWPLWRPGSWPCFLKETSKTLTWKFLHLHKIHSYPLKKPASGKPLFPGIAWPMSPFLCPASFYMSMKSFGLAGSEGGWPLDWSPLTSQNAGILNKPAFLFSPHGRHPDLQLGNTTAYFLLYFLLLFSLFHCSSHLIHCSTPTPVFVLLAT